MSRRRRVIHKEEKLDGRYGSPIVARLISSVMQDGKKSLEPVCKQTAETMKQQLSSLGCSW